MGTFWRSAICFSLLVLPAQASTMPGADRLAGNLALGSGPAIGAQLKLPSIERWQFGASLAVPFYYFESFGTLRYSAWAMSQLMNQDGFFLAGIAGLYGDIYVPDPSRYSPLGLQLGAAIAYQLNPAVTLRLNLVPGVSLQLPPRGWVVVPPAGGFEIGWRFSPQLETTLGYNGNGDILGLNWIF